MSDGFVVPDGWVAIAPLHRVVLKYLKGQRARALKEPANAYLGRPFLHDRVPEFTLLGLPVDEVLAPLAAAGLIEDATRWLAGGELMVGITDFGMLCLLFGVMPGATIARDAWHCGAGMGVMVTRMREMMLLAGWQAKPDAGPSAALRSAQDDRHFGLGER